MAIWKMSKQSLSLIAVFCISITMLPNAVFALPDEANLDRYMLAAKRHVANQEYDKASDYLTRAQALEIALPAEHYFLLAQVQAHKNEIDKARASYEAYVNKTGREGEHYTAALERITDLEELSSSRKTLKKSSDQLKSNPITASNPKNLDQEYLERIKSLYLTGSEEIALVKHINSILGSSPYTGAGIKRSGEKSLAYKISVNSDNQIIITRQDYRPATTKITTEQVDVYGKNPFISYECDRPQNSCWLKNSNSFGKWIIIDYDEKAASNLAKSMTYLFKTLQAQN